MPPHITRSSPVWSNVYSGLTVGQPEMPSVLDPAVQTDLRGKKDKLQWLQKMLSSHFADSKFTRGIL